MSDESKVYLGNLEYGLTEGDIESAFAQKGLAAKSVRIVKDKLTGRSKGFGFAELESEEDVAKAIESLDGFELKGRSLRVSRAQRKA